MELPRDPAPVLVHGATGVVGQLLCEMLARHAIRFDVAGRSEDRIAALAARFTGVGAVRVGSRASLAEALRGRRLVASCAEGFREGGELLLAAAADAGVSYIDTSRDQAFVARTLAYDAAARKRGACLAPSMGLEVAVADWLAAEATQRFREVQAGGENGDRCDEISVCYVEAGLGESRLLARLGELAQGVGARQWVDGSLRDEEPLVHQRRFAVIDRDGARREHVALSVPGVEALLLPSHTGARSVRTFVTAPRAAAAALVRWAGLRAASRELARFARVATRVRRRAASSPLAKDEQARPLDDGAFEVIVEASRSGVSLLLHARGANRYRTTAAIQAFAVREALEGRMRSTGVVAPSVAFDTSRGVRALEDIGVTFELTERSRER